MRQLIEYDMENGSKVYVEVSEADLEEKPISEAGMPDRIIRAKQTFEAALGDVKRIAESITAQVSDLSDKPDEMTVEFGLKFNAGAGVIIAAAGIEANYRITLTWKRNREIDSD